MKKTGSTPQTVLETIMDWSQARSPWQCDALRHIVSKGKLDNADLQELVELCKLGRGAAGNGLKSSSSTKSHPPANPGQGSAVSLISIADVDGVNNLAPDQTLTFEPSSGITIIYGEQRHGKIGLRAHSETHLQGTPCRQDRVQCLRATTISANLCDDFLRCRGVAPAPENWEAGDHPHPTMSAVSVFDSECATVHINEKNKVAFRHGGIDIPEKKGKYFTRTRRGSRSLDVLEHKA